MSTNSRNVSLAEAAPPERPWPAGADRIILPHESFFSITTYVAWRNSFSSADFYRLLSTSRNIYKSSFLTPSGWASGISTNFGIDVKLLNEREGVENIVKCCGHWFSVHLKICPICFENGFHTYWFQLIDFEYCPIHGCAIVSYCQSCGESLPGYHYSRKLFNSPYYCYRCGKPLSGAMPTLESLNEFRLHRDEIVRRFSVYQSWLDGIKEKSHTQCRNLESNLSRAGWFSLSRMNSDFRRLCHPLPPGYGVPKHLPRLSLLRVRQQMVTKIPFLLSRYHTEWKTWDHAWEAFARRINLWLFGEENYITERNASSNLHSSFQDNVILANWKDEELALRVFFCVFYSGSGERKYLSGTLWEGRFVRRELMALLLGAFAGCVYRIRNLRFSNSRITFFSLITYARPWEACSVNYSNFGFVERVVIYPKISRLPVRWNAAIRDSYKKT